MSTDTELTDKIKHWLAIADGTIANPLGVTRSEALALAARCEREAFFYIHAGWSYDPATETSEEGRRRCAVELAGAEAWAQSVGITFDWSDDWDVGHHGDYYGAGSAYDDREPETCETCIAYLPNSGVSASLGCIDDADANYRRVVEAELADEIKSQVPLDLVPRVADT